MNLWVDEYKYCKSSNFLEFFFLAEATTFLLTEENSFQFHVMISPEAAALQKDIFSQDAPHHFHYLLVNNQKLISAQLG